MPRPLLYRRAKTFAEIKALHKAVATDPELYDELKREEENERHYNSEEDK